MKKIGLTGNIGTGKTTVAWMFENLGASVINTDKISHETIEPNTHVWKMLFDRYGRKIMLPGHVINNKALANIIFNDDNERKFVESLIHPKVREEISKRIAESKRKNANLVVVEVPLLFEVKMDKDMDCIVVVKCDLEQQIARCQEKFGMTRQEVMLRIKAQKPLEEKLLKADYIIDNAGSQSETLAQVRRVYSSLKKGDLHPKK